MSKLFKLMYGKSKKRMHPIMIDEKHKCENYMKARVHTTNGWHEVVPADEGEDVWRQKSCTVGGNKPSGNTLRIGHGPSGYINKRGFNEHT